MRINGLMLSLMMRITKWLMVGLGLPMIVLTIISTSQPQSTIEINPADVIIIHGAGGEDNELIQPSIERAMMAAKAYHAGIAPLLFFTGGRDKPGNRAISEMMAEIAINEGVPKSAIMFETESQSTLQNLRFAKEALGGFDRRIVLISHGFHLPRVKYTAQKLGATDVQVLSAGVTYAPWYSSGIYIMLRELIAWPVNLLRIEFNNKLEPDHILLR